MGAFSTNVIVSYSSQIYIVVMSLMVMPLYLNRLGAESYGLIGFFSMLQAWLQLFDFGLSPTVSRECSRYIGGAIDSIALWRLLRPLQIIFFLSASFASIVFFFAAPWIASNWLKIDKLSPPEVIMVVRLIAVAIGFRWISGLYRGALGGLEQLVWIGGFNAVIATARFLMVIPVMDAFGKTPYVFFSYQVSVAIIECIALVWKTFCVLPSSSLLNRQGLRLRDFRGQLFFSLSIAFSGAVWVGVTQTDKLILSKLLSLAQYADFTLTVHLASGINIIGGPLSVALLPRLSLLYSQSKANAAIEVYRQGTQIVSMTAVTVAIVLFTAPEIVLLAWTGNRDFSHGSAPILRLYAAGNGILSLSAFPYYLQFAQGNLRLHFLGNLLYLVALIPSIVFATVRYGVVGAAWSWMSINLIYALFWVPVVHRKVAPGLHLLWIWRDILVIVIPSAVVALSLKYWLPQPIDRFASCLAVAGLGCIVVLSSVCFSSLAREKLASWLLVYRKRED